MVMTVRIMLTMTRGLGGSWNLFDERERARGFAAASFQPSGTETLGDP